MTPSLGTCRCRPLNAAPGCSPARWRARRSRCCVAVLTGLVGARRARAARPLRRPWCSSRRRPRRLAAASSPARLRSASRRRRRSSRTRPARSRACRPRASSIRPKRTSRARWMEGFYPIYGVAEQHVRRQLAADRLDPQTGVGVLDRAIDLPRPELRRLLRRPDAVQRQERPGHHLGPGQRLLHLRPAPGRL